MRKLRYTRNRGSVAFFAFVGLVPLIGAIGGFAVDCMHVNDEKGAVQRSTDAAALAGAQDLWHYQRTGGLSDGPVTTTGAGNQPPLNFALQVASMNAVDGDGLYTTAGRTVTAKLTKSAGWSGSYPDECTVDATVNIRSLLFSLMHNNFGTQTVTSHSKAKVVNVTKLAKNGAYPFVLGYNNPQPDFGTGPGPSLSTLVTGGTIHEGDTFTWVMSGNAEWTGGPNKHDSNTVTTAQSAYGTPGVNGQTWDIGNNNGIDGLSLGGPADLSNGMIATAESNLTAVPAGTMLLVAIVDDASTSGQQTVRGFLVIKFVKGDPTLAGYNNGHVPYTGTIISTVVPPGMTGGGTDDDGDIPKNFKTSIGPKLARLVE